MICPDAFTRVVSELALEILDFDLVLRELPFNVLSLVRNGHMAVGLIAVYLVVVVEEFDLFLREFVVFPHFEDSVDNGDVHCRLLFVFEEIRGENLTENVLAVSLIHIAHEDREVAVVRTVLRHESLLAILNEL